MNMRHQKIPDNLILKLLDERLSQLDCSTQGWVLKGFPRTREQAENGRRARTQQADRVFFLDVPNDSIHERLTMRSLDVVTGNRYHALYNPAPTLDMKERSAQHPADFEESIRERLAAFYAYFVLGGDRGLLRGRTAHQWGPGSAHCVRVYREHAG